MKQPWQLLPANLLPIYCTWEQERRYRAPIRRFKKLSPFDALENYTPLYTEKQVLAFGKYAVDKYAANDASAPATPIDRLRHAAKQFELALNEIGTVNGVSVDLINIRKMEDKEDRYAYVVRIEHTTTEQVYP